MTPGSGRLTLVHPALALTRRRGVARRPENAFRTLDRA